MFWSQLIVLCFGLSSLSQQAVQYDDDDDGDVDNVDNDVENYVDVDVDDEADDDVDNDDEDAICMSIRDMSHRQFFHKGSIPPVDPQ